MQSHVRFASRFSFIVLAAVLIGAAAGCYPVTQLQGPRTVAPGEFQGAVAAGTQVLGRSLHDEPRGVAVDAALRYGVTDHADVSLRLRPALWSVPQSTVELGAKFQWVRDEEIELSIAPSVLRTYVTEATFDDQDATSPDEHNYFTFGRLALLAGTNADKVASVWVAPAIDLGARWYPVDGERRYQPLVALGSCGGVAVRVGSDVQLLLQGGLSIGAAGEDRATQGQARYETVLGPGDLIAEASIGLLMGGFRD